jgi:hypothetical protein
MAESRQMTHEILPSVRSFFLLAGTGRGCRFWMVGPASSLRGKHHHPAGKPRPDQTSGSASWPCRSRVWGHPMKPHQSSLTIAGGLPANH